MVYIVWAVARPLKEYITTIRNCINPDLEIGLGDIPYSERQVMYLCADISKLQKDTGFTVKYDFKTGINETMQSIIKQQ